MINLFTLLILKAINHKHGEKLYNMTPLLIHMIRNSMLNAATYKCYDYFKMAYKINEKHDVTTKRHNFKDFLNIFP